MTTKPDIVKGLRISAELQRGMGLYGPFDADVAADEIERLRARVAELEAMLSKEATEREARMVYYRKALE